MENTLDDVTISDFSKLQVDNDETVRSTSPSQLNEVSTCPDFTFSSSLRTPDAPMRGRSVKEVEDQLRNLKKENFNLKLRIYFLEERMGGNFNLNKENLLKDNVELKVEVESLKKELSEKYELLCQAVKAMDLEEEEFKKTAQAKNDEILTLKQEIEELKLQLQDVRYENDNESSHKSYHSESIFLSTQLLSLPESNGKIKALQEKIASLEKELNHEKENTASLQLVLDQTDAIHVKYEQLQAESEKKAQTIVNLTEDLQKSKDLVADLTIQVKNLQKASDQAKTESERVSNLLAEKSNALEVAEDKITEFRRDNASLKQVIDREKQKFERNKVVSGMKVTELEEELEKQKTRVQDLQKKLNGAHQELKENQNLLVPKSPKRRSIATNTDRDHVSVSNAATSLGVPKEDALRDALTSPTSPSKSPVSRRNFDFNAIYKILNTINFTNKPQLIKLLEQLKETLSKSEEKIVHLKAQELKACAIIKNLMQFRKNSEETYIGYKNRIAELEKELEGVVSRPTEPDSFINDHEVPKDNLNKSFIGECACGCSCSICRPSLVT